MIDLKQSTATDRLVFMTDSADHVTGKAGLTLTITASKAGAAFGSITPTVTDLGSGWYSLAFTTTITNTLGDLALHITSTGADPTDVKFNITANILGDTLPASIQSVAAGAIAAASFASGAFDAVWSVATRVLTAATNLTTALATPTNITAGTITTVTNVTNDVGITQTGADKVWGSAARTLTSFGTLVADVAAAVWAAATRTLTAFAFTPSLDAAYDAAKTAASPADVATALNTYDAPTKAEFDAAVALLATAAALATVGTNVLSRASQVSADADHDLTQAGLVSALSGISGVPAATAAAVTSDHGVGSYIRNTEPPTAAQNADGWIARTRAGGADGGRTLGQSLAPLRNKVAMTAINESAGTATMTVYADDDTTPLYTYAVSLTTLAKSMTALDPTA